ncbi:MAG: hypothetical protein AAF934_11255, partial [Bacteroidota bacterium]
NGRNNPSMKIVIAFLQKFPKINARWLLTGEGKMYNKKCSHKADKAQSYQQLLQQIPIHEIHDFIGRNKQTIVIDDNDFLSVSLKVFFEEQINARLNALEGKVTSLLSEKNEK